ncbi:MAG: TerC family protein, partial [Anaerolineales bacterium]
MSALTQPEVWIALLTLTALEIVLGIDNIVFISILSGKLPPGQRDKGRLVGLGAAMFTRILLLFSLAWVIGLTQPFLTVFGFEFAGRDIILIGGGLFLLAKSTDEIHDKLEGEEGHRDTAAAPSFAGVITQIALLDIVFSLDSVITAVGMARDLWVMVTAIVV